MHTHTIAAAAQAAGISTVAGVGLSLGAVALLIGLAIGLHHKKKSPKVIGWLCFLIGIPLALGGLLSGLLGYISGLTLWSIPVSLALVGYVGFVFFHDGTRKGKPHRWLQPVFGLVLPTLLLTLGGGLGHAAHGLMDTIDHGAGSVVSSSTGQ